LGRGLLSHLFQKTTLFVKTFALTPHWLVFLELTLGFKGQWVFAAQILFHRKERVYRQILTEHPLCVRHLHMTGNAKTKLQKYLLSAFLPKY
jgi:hypothetical protein